jgi:hypothetical protein
MLHRVITRAGASRDAAPQHKCDVRSVVDDGQYRDHVERRCVLADNAHPAIRSGHDIVHLCRRETSTAVVAASLL